MRRNHVLVRASTRRVSLNDSIDMSVSTWHARAKRGRGCRREGEGRRNEGKDFGETSSQGRDTRSCDQNLRPTRTTHTSTAFILLVIRKICMLTFAQAVARHST